MRSLFGTSLLFRALILIIFEAKTISSDETDEKISIQTKYQIRTTFCKDRVCLTECSQVVTPLGSCYNGRHFSNFDEKNNPYGNYDIFDELEEDKFNSRFLFKRSFYESEDGTCLGDVTDSFNALPLNECVGPFGEPRPWGKFELIGFVPEEEIKS